ncbi:MAG: right-handed parallel beta-helix repeat-containing protein [Bacteroidales bacterium]|nr:right-handed parallel beta-helix repeat-containing protein [Bacteroidales bacterium]
MKKITCIVIATMLFSTISIADTHIPAGTVSGTWTQAGSPYIIDGEINIPVSGQLMIDPGVRIVFSGHYKFIVYGRIEAVGSASDSIFFTAQTAATGWWGLRFINTDGNGQGSSKLAFCRIEHGKATGFSSDRFGGAIYCLNSSPLLIDHCTLVNNYAVRYGGGVYCENSDIQISNTLIAFNEATDTGGGIYCILSDPWVTQVTLGENIATNNGGGLMVAVTIPLSAPSLNDCILWDNQPQEIYAPSSNLVVTYSDVQGGWPGTGNINGDPMFINPAAGDFSIAPCSPCVDAGDPSSPPDPDGTPADMGAFYFNQLDGTVVPPGNVTGTWSSSASPYLVCGNISIPAGAHLTIEPGTQVIFMGHYKFTVNGTIGAQGNPSDSIVFTADQPAAGWHGFRFININTQDTSRLEYCTIEYGKASGTGPDNLGGAFYLENSSKLVINNCSVGKNSATGGGGGFYLTQSSPRIISCRIYYNEPAGIMMTNTSTPLVSGCIVEWNSGYGIHLASSNCMPTVTYCMVDHNDHYPVYAFAQQVGGFSGNSFSGNLYQKFYVVSGTISMDAIWDDPGIPCFISGNLTIQGTDGLDGVTVLELTPGVELQMTSLAGIQVGHPSNPAFPGGLMALGTMNDSIVFTAGTTSPSPGYWAGITIEQYASDAHCRMEYCVVEYGGYSSYENICCNQSSPFLSHSSSRNGSGAGIFLNFSQAQISHCSFTGNTTYGINCTESAPMISNCDAGFNSGPGIYITGYNSLPQINSCHIYNNTGNGINAASCDKILINGCIIENNASYGIYSGTSSGDIALTGTQINGNNNFPVYVYAGQIGGFAGNSYSANLHQKIFVVGEVVSKDAEWEHPGIPYFITGNLTIQGTDGTNGVTTLALEPGCELRFASSVYLQVGHASNSGYPGGLLAAGTGQQPVVFTANLDTPVPGYWSGIYFAPYSADSLCILDHCTVEYGGYSNFENISCFGSSPSVSNSRVMYGSGSGIFLDSGSNPVIHQCIISHNLASGIECANGSEPLITDNDICSNDLYGIRILSGSDPEIINNILYGNVSPIHASSPVSSVYYNDLWLNDSIIMTNLPAGFGNLVTFNVNGKACDPFYNIFLDPVFVDPLNLDYRITMMSPCINAGDPNLPYDPDGTIGDIGVYFHTLDGDPEISSILDVPNDQGKKVLVTWQKSPLDTLGSPVPVSFYTLWRLDDFTDGTETIRLISDPEDMSVISTKDEIPGDETIVWYNGELFLTYITQVPAIGFDEYSVVAPTLFDSCETSVNYTTFQVLAHMYSPQMYYASLPDSGYSVDNLAPHVPDNFTGMFANGEVMLHWSPVPDEDFQYYALYRSTDPISFPNQPFAATTDTGYFDADILADTVYYLVTAFDFNGNESGASQVVEVITFSGLVIDLKAFLEGPFDGSGMITNLNINCVIPLSQPYSQSPWLYSGTENVAAIPSADIVDWILVDLRDAPDAPSAVPSTRIARQAGFIKNDGIVTTTDGISPMVFNVSFSQQLYAVIWHRNHIPVMSALPLTETGGLYTYDFTSGAGQVYGGTLAHKELAPGIWGMIASDGNADSQINNTDKIEVWNPQAGSGGYKSGDFDMNGEVNNGDKNDVRAPNTGLGGQVPD